MAPLQFNAMKKSILIFIASILVLLLNPKIRAEEALPEKPEPGVIRVLLIGGGSSHDFEKYFHQADAATLKTAGKMIPAYAGDAPAALKLMPNSDVIVFSANHAQYSKPDFQKAINAFADSGHGVITLHAGTWYSWKDELTFNKRFVGGGTKSHGKGEFKVFNKQPEHPIMKDVPADFKIIDEHYRMALDADNGAQVLAETGIEPQSKKAYPAVWIVKDDKAKIVGITLGHADEAHSNPAYQKLLVNAVRWVAGQ